MAARRVAEEPGHIRVLAGLHEQAAVQIGQIGRAQARAAPSFRHGLSALCALRPHRHPRVWLRSRVESRNPAGAACVQPVMTDYTDDELSLMHLDGNARALYDALDQVDFLLWMIRGI